MSRKRAYEFEELKQFNSRDNRLKNAPMNQVKIYREAKHMTQGELAEAAGVHRETISRLERQGTRPHRYIAEAIAKALDISVDQVYGTAVAPPYVDARLYNPSKSGEYLCAYRRNGCHDFNYFVAYFDKLSQEWSLPVWMDFHGSDEDGAVKNLPVRWWTKLPYITKIGDSYP